MNKPTSVLDPVEKEDLAYEEAFPIFIGAVKSSSNPVFVRYRNSLSENDTFWEFFNS